MRVSKAHKPIEETIVKEALEFIAQNYPKIELFYSTGGTIEREHLMLTQDPFEVRVWFYPEGSGYLKPATLKTFQK